MEKEPPKSNTYVLDSESPVEMARLIDLDRITTKAMGGPLVGVTALASGAKVLDLACGPGGWVLDVAFERPDVEVAGVDISAIMIAYANARARTQKLGNASFGEMNLTQPLDFSDNTFDLVNARLLAIVLRRTAWDAFLAECTRILKPGGILRLTEPMDIIGTTNSVAYNRVGSLLSQAAWQAGYGFSVDGNTMGLTHALPRTLRNIGYRNVHCLANTLEFSADCEPWQDVYRNTEALSTMMPQFFAKAGVATHEEAQQLFQQSYVDLLSADFRGLWHLVTILGDKP